MASTIYQPWAVTAGEIPTTAYWNLLGSNDASFNTGQGFNDGIIIQRHLATGIQPVILEKNPNKFSVYRNGGYTSSGQNPIIYDTVLFDSASAYNTATGIYTIPTTGFYYFQANALQVATTGNRGVGITMFQTGSQNITLGADNHVVMYGGTYQDHQGCFGFSSCVSGDTIKIADSGNSGFAFVNGSAFNFSGFMVSAS